MKDGNEKIRPNGMLRRYIQTDFTLAKIKTNLTIYLYFEQLFNLFMMLRVRPYLASSLHAPTGKHATIKESNSGEIGRAHV